MHFLISFLFSSSNIKTTAEDILEKKGVVILPDILTNAGGVTVHSLSLSLSL